MNTNELISVIVPVYNVEKYLRDCLDSIVNQSYKNIEIILVDDGSKDKSGEICDEYAKNDDRIRVFHKENGGAASARNLGIDNAKGDYLGFVDSDDYIAPDMYEKLLETLKKHDLPYIDSGMVTVSDDNRQSNQDTDMVSIISGEEAIGHLLDRTGYCSLCTRLFKAEVFKDNFRIPEGKRVEDFIFCIRLFDKFGTEALYDHVFYHVVPHSDSVTHSGGCSLSLDTLFYADEVEKLVHEKYPSLIEKSEFFKFYYIGQLLIKSTSSEYEKYSEEYSCYIKYLRRNKSKILNNNFLTKKLKGVLLSACVNYRLPAMIYRGKQKNGK